MIIGQLYRPFAFNLIRSKELQYVRFHVPAAITMMLALIYFLLPKQPEIWGDKKYLDYMLQIVGILPGFYIAALAAGATFANNSLDETMPGSSPPTITIERMGQRFDETLSTRLFICYLFAYLSAASLVLAFGILLAIQLNPSVEHIISENPTSDTVRFVAKSIQYAYVMGITFYIAKLTTVTLHGLYFLAERMHQHND